MCPSMVTLPGLDMVPEPPVAVRGKSPQSGCPLDGSATPRAAGRRRLIAWRLSDHSATVSFTRYGSKFVGYHFSWGGCGFESRTAFGPVAQWQSAYPVDIPHPC